ncbi:phosphatidylinositol N-acetylglucosaminyltransferase subunit C [Acrasis kona]|uniref:Phosphatidylinositol N-acetylglucosaminyltransferase subunit C n=1 Tax=Acrasis kona TaxID=1008807 RepID=A0AAW2YYQ6_9EUKA
MNPHGLTNLLLPTRQDRQDKNKSSLFSLRLTPLTTTRAYNLTSPSPSTPSSRFKSISPSPMFQSPREPPFKKVLYSKQAFEDNFVSKDFLASMSKNAHVMPYEYWSSVAECVAVGQQFSLVVLYALIFLLTLEETISDRLLILINLGLFAIGYLLYTASERLSNERLSRAFTQNTLLVGVLLFLSPILRTLTESISSDTIYAVTLVLIIIHLIGHDYAFVNATSDRFQCYLSLNSIIAVSILFASRLPSALHSFGVIAFAIVAFIMFPYLRHSIKRRRAPRNKIVTWVLSSVTFILTAFTISFKMALLYAVIINFILFMVPAWLMTVQNYKE